MKIQRLLMLWTLIIPALGFGFQAEPAQLSQDDLLRMAEDVRKAVVTLPEYGVFDQIKFEIRGRIVVLQGYASRPILRDSAEKVTKKIKGVEDVINGIELLSFSSADDKIRYKVYVAIYGDTVLGRYNPNRGKPIWNSLLHRTIGITNDPPLGNHPIRIIVNNGHVILEGIVENAGDRVIAGIKANSVPGVFSITNDIEVPDESK